MKYRNRDLQNHYEEFFQLHEQLIEEIKTAEMQKDSSEVSKKSCLTTFLKVQEISDTYNFYWEFCRFNAYKLRFEEQHGEYLSEYPDAELKDFLYSELRTLRKSIIQKPSAKSGLSAAHYFIEIDGKIIELGFYDTRSKKSIGFSTKKKIDFIVEKIKGLKVDEKGGIVKEVVPSTSTPPEIEEEFIGVTHMSGARKIIFLNELGVISFLKDKYPEKSNRGLAEIITKFVDIGLSNATSLINPILNEACDQTKSPYHSESSLDKVKSIMEDLEL